MAGGSLPRFVLHMVPFEDDSSLELPDWIARRQLRAFFYTNLEEPANMCFGAGAPGSCSHICPLSDTGLIPNTSLPKAGPLLKNGLKSLGLSLNLFLAHRPSNTCIEVHLH